tara:strand:+ start:43574 stop:43777 length:204 start_codon:yes stop_codon:yes gene_type:complete
MTNQQLDKLYEIRSYLLETARELSLSGYDTNDEDAEINIVLKYCDELLDELDPSSDYNTGDQNEICN